MKEAVVWYFIWLVKVFVAWVLLIIAAVLVCLKAGPSVRFLVVGAAVLWLPLYVVIAPKLAERALARQEAESLEIKREITAKTTTLYAELCAAAPAIKVWKTVPHREPLDIELIEPKSYGAMEVQRPVMQRKTVCWLDAAAGDCKQANIRHVEWSHRFHCRIEDRNCQPKYFRNDRLGNHMIPIDGPTAPYLLSVSEPERVNPLIERYRLRITERGTGELLATAEILNRGGYFEIPRDEAAQKQAPFCPDRDLQIAEMLSLVFPKPEMPDGRR